MVSEIFGKAVMISFVYSFNKNLNATGATKTKQNAAPRKNRDDPKKITIAVNLISFSYSAGLIKDHIS